MSPKVLAEGALIFWFHSHDALHENRASVHVGKGSQSDSSDAKIWLEPDIEVGDPGCILSQRELRHALKLIENNLTFLLEEWHGYKRRAG